MNFKELKPEDKVDLIGIMVSCFAMGLIVANGIFTNRGDMVESVDTVDLKSAA